MSRRPPRSTLSSSSAASDVYKRQIQTCLGPCGNKYFGTAPTVPGILQAPGPGAVQFNFALLISDPNPYFGPPMPFLISYYPCLLYTSPSPRDRQKSRMPSSA
eukprot:TRINITY_DN2224_c0_g2_i1.p2 TRINITY_DN2224_c0_g2~~TRINITY_DN2224_c0_g2_i1.p2  ORF type:complete len:103 (+),score=14.28 TRINITY_DN2224_c0_g2_i1:85-393(+)